MTNDLAIWLLQGLASVMIVISIGLAAWALRQVFQLRADHERLKGRVEAEMDDTKRRFDDIRVWMRDITKKLDRLIDKLFRE